METSQDEHHPLMLLQQGISDPAERAAYEASLKRMINLYGFLSIGLTAFIPLLWRLYLIDTTSLNTTGYKVAAYVNLFTWSPYVGAVLLFWLSGSSDLFVDWVVGAMRFSILGPWFVNFFAIYVIGKTGLSETSPLQISSMTGYVFYSFVTMVLQFRMTPSIQAYQTRNDPYKENLYRDYREPEQDLEPAPPMEDTSYLEPGQDASGEWPTDEERA